LPSLLPRSGSPFRLPAALSVSGGSATRSATEATAPNKNLFPDENELQRQTREA